MKSILKNTLVRYPLTATCVALSALIGACASTPSADSRNGTIQRTTFGIAHVTAPDWEGIAYGTAPTPDGRWLLVTLIKDNKVGVVDLKSMKVTRTFDVPRAPQEIVVRPDGTSAYVSCDASHQVAVLDLTNWKVEKLIDAGPGADGLAWAKGE